MKILQDKMLGFLDSENKIAKFGCLIQLSANKFLDEETGYLHCKTSILGHVGTLKYLDKELGLGNNNEIIEVDCHAEDLFDEDSLASLEKKPLTENHPKELVNSKNYNKYLKGICSDVNHNDSAILGDLVIYDEKAIDKVQNGELTALSLGYTAKLVLKDGRWCQTERKYNHISLVKKGRAKYAQVLDEDTTSSKLYEIDRNYRDTLIKNKLLEYSNGNDIKEVFYDSVGVPLKYVVDKGNGNLPETVILNDEQKLELEDMEFLDTLYRVKCLTISKTEREYNSETGEETYINNTHTEEHHSQVNDEDLSNKDETIALNDNSDKIKNEKEGNSNMKTKEQILKEWLGLKDLRNSYVSMDASEFRDNAIAEIDANFIKLNDESISNGHGKLPTIVEVVEKSEFKDTKENVLDGIKDVNLVGKIIEEKKKLEEQPKKQMYDTEASDKFFDELFSYVLNPFSSKYADAKEGVNHINKISQLTTKDIGLGRGIL